MKMTDLTLPFALNIKYIAPLHYITFNGRTTVLNDDELESLEFGLTDFAHALCMYQATILERDHV